MPFGVFPTWSTWSFAVSCQRTIETKECECHARLLCGGKIEMYSMFQIKSKVHIWGRICVCSCCQNGKNWWDAWDKKWSHTTVFEFPTFFNNYDIQHENRSIRFMHFYKLTSNALECLFSSFSRHFLLMPGFFLLFFNVILIIIMNMMWSSIFHMMKVTTANCLFQRYDKRRHIKYFLMCVRFFSDFVL